MKTRITGLFGTPPHPIIQDLMPKLDSALCGLPMAEATALTGQAPAAAAA